MDSFAAPCFRNVFAVAVVAVVPKRQAFGGVGASGQLQDAEASVALDSWPGPWAAAAAVSLVPWIAVAFVVAVVAFELFVAAVHAVSPSLVGWVGTWVLRQPPQRTRVSAAAAARLPMVLVLAEVHLVPY